MQTYLINELERLTGVKAHTIRIWEKRYGLIAPERTTTNRRYYNDKQVKKLLNVATLLAYGKKISKIAELSEDELNNEILKGATPRLKNNMLAGYINDLVAAMLVFDEIAFEQTFSSSVTNIGFYDTMINVVYPFLNKTGAMWSADIAAPVQEHFASGIIRRKLMAATDALPKPVVGATSYLLFLPEGEWHDIGLMFADYIIRSKGHKTIYLGQNVPFENIDELCGAVVPDLMLLFYITAKPKDEIAAEIKGYAAINKDIKLLAAGNNDLLPLKTKLKNVTYLTDVNGLLEIL